MRSLLPLALLVFGIPALSLPSEAASAQAAKTRVLIVSGANNHDWEWTTPSLAGILRASADLEVDVTYEPSKTLGNLEHLEKYAAIVLDYNGPRWGEPAESNFLKVVRGGTGVAVVHAANNAFRGWIEYEKLVGHMWREGTGHGRFHAYDVRMTDRVHPITRGLPDLKAHPDELYHRLVPMHGPQHRVLAVAHSSIESGGTGQDEPMILVGSYGAGRVFHTPLGHVWKDNLESRESHTDPQFHTVLVRGVQWAATGRVRDGDLRPNTLTETERRLGWKLLFDGHSTDGWRGYNKEAFPVSGWELEAGCLHHVAQGGGGDLITAGTFGDFELSFEWKVARGANSGIKYRLEEKAGSPTAPEYQVLDDFAGGEATKPLQGTAALYAVAPPVGKQLEPTGSFNKSRIVARGNRIEHWLNGTRVLVCDVSSDDWKARLAKSKFKGIADEFGQPKQGHILLQDHGDEVWYRSIKLRELPVSVGNEVPIFDGTSLAGWRQVGDARWSVEDDCIVGEVGGGGQSFLVTEETFGDFIFETDLKFEVRGNSGIQIRSHQRPNGRVFGYQIEIDSSKRAWSGGLFDEARRGWLDDLKEDEIAREAFDLDGWNHYRIECVGSHIQVWVNGIQTTDYFDTADLDGFIALQIHSGSRGKLRWRHPRLWNLGRHEWRPIFDGSSLDDFGPANGGITFKDGPTGLWEATEGAYAMTRHTIRDKTVRVRFMEDTELFAISMQTHTGPHSVTPPPPAKFFPSPLGLLLRPAGAPSYKPGEWNELVLATTGNRVVAILNGKRVDEMRDAPLDEFFRWALVLPWKDGKAGTYFVQNIENLVAVE